MEINSPLQGVSDVLSHQALSYQALSYQALSYRAQCAPFGFISPNSRALNLLVQTLFKYCQLANLNCWFDERRRSFISREADQCIW